MAVSSGFLSSISHSAIGKALFVCAAVVSTVSAGAISTSYAGPLYDEAFEARYNDFENSGTLQKFSSAAVKEGQYDQALSTLEQILFRQPNDVGARLSIARIYYHVGSFDLALGHVNQGLLVASGGSLEEQLLELKKRIEKAQSRVTARLDVTLGGQVDFARSSVDDGVTPTFEGTSFGGYAYLDGVIDFDLDTPTRDVLTLSGGATVSRSYADIDFDNDYEQFTAGSGYGSITYSKGLPGIIDTLRWDVSGYGEVAGSGSARTRREIGVRSRVSVRPTVESSVFADFGYGYLGSSSNVFVDHQYKYGVGGLYRFAPGWTGFAYVGREHTEGMTNAPFSYNVAKTNARVWVSHLLHVFADGRSWFTRLSASYSNGTALDYSTLNSTAPRSGWQVNWDHTVQTGTDSSVRFGVGYRDDTFGVAGSRRHSTGINARAQFTYRFQ